MSKLAVLLSMLALAGCQSFQLARNEGPGCLAGTVVGAAVGGTAGAAVGAGAGTLVATAGGIALGGAVGYLVTPGCQAPLSYAPGIVVK